MSDREYRVVGVMPASFEPLDAERYYNASAEMWAPIGYDLNGDSSCRSCQHLRGFGRLKRGVSVAAASAEMNAIREQMRREHPTDYDAGSLAVIPLRGALTGNVQGALYVLLGAVGFVLLIACANVANLLLARSVTRQRELALRAVLGAGRARIIRQLLTESLMLERRRRARRRAARDVRRPGARGVRAGFTAAARAHRRRRPRARLHRGDRGRDRPLLRPGAGVARLGAAGAQQKLAVDSRGSVGGRSRARAILVVADLVLALVLLAGAGLMLRTVVALTHANPGFNPSQILSLQFSLIGTAYADDADVRVFQDRVVERLRALPGVTGAALAGQIPFGGNYDCSALHVNGRMKPNPVDDPCVERYGITAGLSCA